MRSSSSSSITLAGARGPYICSAAAKLVERMQTDPSIQVVPQTRKGFLAGIRLYAARPNKGLQPDRMHLDGIHEQGGAERGAQERRPLHTGRGYLPPEALSGNHSAQGPCAERARLGLTLNGGAIQDSTLSLYFPQRHVRRWVYSTKLTPIFTSFRFQLVSPDLDFAETYTFLFRVFASFARSPGWKT